MLHDRFWGLRFDPEYEKIFSSLLREPRSVSPTAFARAWFSSPTATWAPKVRYLGPWCPAGNADLAGIRSPRSTTSWLSHDDIAELKSKILGSGLTVSELVSTAWASASTFRRSDKRARRQWRAHPACPAKDWEVNGPGPARKGSGEAGGDPEGL